MAAAQFLTLAEQIKPPRNFELVQPSYVSLPYPPCFYTKIFELYQPEFKYTPKFSFDINTIDTLFQKFSDSVHKDLPRTLWKMEKDDKISSGETFDETFEKLQKKSTDVGINLTIDEIKALNFFAMFFHNEFLQGGIFSLQKCLLDDLFSYYGQRPDNDARPHIITRENGYLVISLEKNAATQNPEDSAAIHLQFKLEQVDNIFTLTFKKQVININQSFWEDNLIPSALDQLNELDNISANDKHNKKTLMQYIPLLCDRNFIFPFFEKLLQKDQDTQQFVQEGIALCFSERPADLARIMGIQQFLQAKMELQNIIQDNRYASRPRSKAAIILKNLNNTLHNIEGDQFAPVAFFLRRMATSIQSPKFDNNLQELINIASANLTWNKCVGGSGAILAFVGSILIVASITLAAVSLGSSTLLSSWGITIGKTLLMQYTAAGVIVGAGLTAGGVKLVKHQPNYLATPNSLFWHKLKNQPNTEVPQPPSSSLTYTAPSLNVSQ